MNICWYSLFWSCDLALVAKNGGKSVREQHEFTLWEDVNTEKVAYDLLEKLWMQRKWHMTHFNQGMTHRNHTRVMMWMCKGLGLHFGSACSSSCYWTSRKEFEYSPSSGKSRPAFSHADVHFWLLNCSQCKWRESDPLSPLEARPPWLSMLVLISKDIYLVVSCSCLDNARLA